MIRQLLVAAALASVAATAMAGLARVPADHSHPAHDARHCAAGWLSRNLADNDGETSDSGSDKAVTGVPTGIRAALPRGYAPLLAERSPTLLNTLSGGASHRWSF